MDQICLCDNIVTPYTIQHSRWWPQVPSKQRQHDQILHSAKAPKQNKHLSVVTVIIGFILLVVKILYLID